VSNRRWWLLLFPALLMLLSVPAYSSRSGNQDPLEKGWSQYSLNNNPVERAKILSRLAPRQMSSIRELVSNDQADKALSSLQRFRDAVAETTNSLTAGGIDASKRPNGFKELQISLRTFLHKLDDVTLSLQQDARPAYQAARTDLESAENALIEALFPKQDPKQDSKRQASAITQ
jgi:hypothetical protein